MAGLVIAPVYAFGVTTEQGAPAATSQPRETRMAPACPSCGFDIATSKVVAELRDGVLVPVGQVKFGLGGKKLWQRLAPLHQQGP